MTDTQTLALAAGGAALAAAAGALPFALGRGRPVRRIAWANAVAAGLMLGAAFVLAREGLLLQPLPTATGALLGLALLVSLHAFAGVSDLSRGDLETSDPVYGWRVLMLQTIHGSFEGVALGVAAALDLTLGLFLAGALAVHNVAEGTTLAAVLTEDHRVPPARAAVLAVATNGGQILLAVTTFAVLGPGGALLAPTLGLAVAGLLYLVLVDLLPEAYGPAGDTAIAVV
ncbi:MAG: hypothetical protein D6701_05605, partial [Gemmatimonadetes bacterium]